MFDSSVIDEVSYSVHGAVLRLSWRSTAPDGSSHQVYVGRDLAWSGAATTAEVPIPSDSARVTVGAVGPGEESADFSASLPPVPASRARLSWTGGTADGTDLAGFRIYGEPSPGGGVDYDSPLADVQAAAAGFAEVDASTTTYTWTSPPYKTGEWTFAVVPYDAVGNAGTPTTTTVGLTAPPAEVPLVDGRRLTRFYDQSTHSLTIGWAASEG